MGLNFGAWATVLLILGTGLAGAKSLTESERMYLTVKSIRVSQIQTDILNQEVSSNLYEKQLSLPGMPNVTGDLSPGQEVGKVIGTGRELVALGEDVYRLVIKGKPSITTSYAPISVVPKINGQVVEILETEGWSFPKKANYEISYENMFGMEVVKFRYSVLFSYKGSYNGKGAYLTGVQIIPASVSVMFGYDLNATMKLGGIQNNGTKDSPVAAATLLLQYNVSTVIKSALSVDSYFVTGLGKIKRL